MWHDLSHTFTRSFFQQIFSRTSTLFRRYLHTYICLDIYPRTVGVADIEIYLLNCRFTNRILHYLNYWRHLIGHLNDIQCLKSFALREVWLVSVTWSGSNALKWWPCRGPPPPREPCVLLSPHLCYRPFLENVMRLYCKMHISSLFAKNTSASRQNVHDHIFILWHI